MIFFKFKTKCQTAEIDPPNPKSSIKPRLRTTDLDRLNLLHKICKYTLVSLNNDYLKVIEKKLNHTYYLLLCAAFMLDLYIIR